MAINSGDILGVHIYFSSTKFGHTGHAQLDGGSELRASRGLGKLHSRRQNGPWLVLKLHNTGREEKTSVIFGGSARAGVEWERASASKGNVPACRAAGIFYGRWSCFEDWHIGVEGFTSSHVRKASRRETLGATRCAEADMQVCMHA
jgi:hypothetical protein